MTDEDVAKRLEDLKIFTRQTLNVEQRIEIAKQQQAIRDAKKQQKEEMARNKEKARQEKNEKLEQQRKEKELKNQQMIEVRRVMPCWKVLILLINFFFVLGAQEASRRTRTHQARGAAQETTGIVCF